jgi:hypothetical protein
LWCVGYVFVFVVVPMATDLMRGEPINLGYITNSFELKLLE